MARTYETKTINMPTETLERLKRKKIQLGYLGSLTAFVGEIMNRYMNGELADARMMRLEIEAQLRREMLNMSRPPIEVKAHRPRRSRGQDEQRQVS